jgi:crossover junction endodeoxyribonuclease RusA
MSKEIGPWRRAVAAAARTARADGQRPLDGPLAIAVDFWLPRPKTTPKTRLMLPVGPPDIDKLLRGALDPLTQSGVLHDDARIVEWDSSKIRTD